MPRTGQRTGFFTRTPALTKNKHESGRVFINIGGEQFHALAVAFIDSLRNSSRVNEDTLKQVLDRFFTYYPKFKSKQPYLTPAEQMAILMNWPRKSEIVECMAYVLRQLAIDEIYANPLHYREAFDGLESTTPKSYLRDPMVSMPISVVRALAQKLSITITLSFTEHGKELRSREIYTNSSITSSKLELVIQVKGDQCFPGVKNKDDFVYVGQLSISSPEPVEISDENIGTIAEMIALIVEDNKKILQSYLQWRQNFLTMIDGKELTTASMIDLYIEFLPTTNDAFGDTTEFFVKLTKADKNPVTTESLASSNKQVNELLASSLAGWISTSKIEADSLFDRLESQSGRAASPAA